MPASKKGTRSAPPSPPPVARTQSTCATLQAPVRSSFHSAAVSVAEDLEGVVAHAANHVEIDEGQDVLEREPARRLPREGGGPRGPLRLAREPDDQDVAPQRGLLLAEPARHLEERGGSGRVVVGPGAGLAEAVVVGADDDDAREPLPLGRGRPPARHDVDRARRLRGQRHRELREGVPTADEPRRGSPPWTRSWRRPPAGPRCSRGPAPGRAPAVRTMKPTAPCFWASHAAWRGLPPSRTRTIFPFTSTLS